MTSARRKKIKWTRWAQKHPKKWLRSLMELERPKNPERLCPGRWQVMPHSKDSEVILTEDIVL